MMDSHQDFIPRIDHPFATSPTSLYFPSDIHHHQDLAHDQRAHPHSTASGSHTRTLGPHAIQRSASTASMSSARRLDSHQSSQVNPFGSHTAPRHRESVPRLPSSRSLASASKPQAPSSSNTIPLDPDAIVQAAHPDHPDHQLWIERFGGTAARRRTSAVNHPTSTSTSASDPLGPGIYSGTSKRNSSHTYNSRSASARTGASSSLSSSSDEGAFSPSASPVPRPRRRAAASPNSDRRPRRQNGQNKTASAPASSNVSRDSPSLAASTTGKRRKRKDKGKVKAPSPPLPPPRVSSSVATATASENPYTHHQTQSDRVQFPTGGSTPRAMIPFGEALGHVQGTTREPIANQPTLDPRNAIHSRVSPRSWQHQTQNSAMHTNGASSGSRLPGSAHHTPKNLSGGSSSAHASTHGSSSYDTATQNLPRVSSDLSSRKRHAHYDGPVPPFSTTTAEEAHRTGTYNARADSTSSSQAPTANGPAIQPPPTRQRAGSLDLLRETLSFGIVRPAKAQHRGHVNAADPQTAPSSQDNPPPRTNNSGLRIRASLDAIRPNFLTMSTKDTWSQDRSTPSQSLDVSKDADDSMDTTSDKPKRGRMTSFFSTLRNRNNQGRKMDPRAAFSASVDSQPAPRLASQTFAARGSRSMDIPRRPVPNFDDPAAAAAPAVPVIPSSFTMPALSNAADSSLQAPQPPARARLSRVGEETEEGSDYADAQDGQGESVDEFEGDDEAGKARNAAKSKAKLEQMLGEAFPHVPGGAIRRATPPPIADDLRDDEPGRHKTEPRFTEQQRLPEPIYLSQQSRAAALADQTNESGRSQSDSLANSHSAERGGKTLGHRHGDKPPPSVSSSRSHETSYTRSTSGATTVGDSTSNHGGGVFDTDHDTSIDSKHRTGKFASFWNRSKKPKSRQSTNAVEGSQGSELYQMDSTQTSEHAPAGNQQATTGQETASTPTELSRASAMAGLGIAPVLETPSHSTSQSPRDHANQRSVDSSLAPSSPNPARKSGAWRKRVSSISSLRSTRRGRQDWLENAPPTPSLPPSKSEPVGGWANGSQVEEIQGPDEDWRRNLLAEAVNLSLRVPPESNTEQARRNTLWPNSIEGGERVAFESQQNVKPKRSPFLDVVAASRKSFSRDRARPTKAELDELREPGLPTIHKSLSPALLSEIKESHSGHGRSDSMAYSVDSAVGSIEPREDIDDPDVVARSRQASSEQIASPPHSAVTRPLNIVKQSTVGSHSRSTSQQSDNSGSGSARFRVPRVPVPGSAEVANDQDVHGDRDDDERGQDGRLQTLESHVGNKLDVSSSQSSMASPASPASPVSPGKQSGSFAGKRATLGKHATPPCLQLSPPKEEMLRSPSAEGLHTGQGTPRSAQWGRLGTSPGPSLNSRQGVRASPRSPAGFPPSPSNGFSPSGASRTSFSTDRDRAPVASPFVHHAGSSSGPRAGNLRGAFRKFTSSAVSPKVRGFGFSSKGISSDQQPSEEDMPSWDDSLAAAQAATQMLQAHTDMLLPSPSMTPLTATHSRPETASLTGSTTSGGGQGGSSGRFGPFHNGGDSGSGSGIEDREVMSNAFASANKSSSSLGGGGLPGGPMSASGSFARPATSMTYRDHTRSTTAPATSGVPAGVRSVSSSSSLQGIATPGTPSATSSSSFPSDLQALDAMLRAQKTNEEAMLKSISARTRTGSQPQTSSPLPMS